MTRLAPMAGRAFGQTDGLPDFKSTRVPSDKDHPVDTTPQVELYVDGKRVPLSTPVAAALTRGSELAAVEKDKKTGEVGVPLEVRHFRD